MRLVGRVEVVVEEAAKKWIQVPLTVIYKEGDKEKTVRVVATFPLTKDAEVKKYQPKDMNRTRYTLLIEGKANVQAIGSTEPFSIAGCKVVEVK